MPILVRENPGMNWPVSELIQLDAHEGDGYEGKSAYSITQMVIIALTMIHTT